MKLSSPLPHRLLHDATTHETKDAPDGINLSGINETIKNALAAAGLNTRSGPMKGVTDTINQALSAAGLMQRPDPPSGHSVTIDGIFREIDATRGNSDGRHAEWARRIDEPLAGSFLNQSFTNDAGTRTYKLYIPARYSADDCEPVAVIVMLHGCTQSPDDFAAGTRMNALADQHGFLVIYPAQAAHANGSRCWNWFRPEDQGRDSGEPSIIAGITREVAFSYHVDRKRIFVAGLSAGAAMAVILGTMYPDLYVAVGAHSGLPYGAAHDMPSAFAAMQAGRALPRQPKPSVATPSNRAEGSNWTPTIVFHGDHDRTVNARNGTAIVEQVTIVGSDQQPLRANVETGMVPGGRRYSRTDYVDHANQPVVEHWMVHGAGHAWSGGSPNGSFTDSAGPDASAEMIRFFFLQRRAGSA